MIIVVRVVINRLVRTFQMLFSNKTLMQAFPLYLMAYRGDKTLLHFYYMNKIRFIVQNIAVVVKKLL